jgi:hypothetical protein
MTHQPPEKPADGADHPEDAAGTTRGDGSDDVADVDPDVGFDDELVAETINAQPGLADDVQALRDHVAWLTERVDELEGDERTRRYGPAPWVLHTPPAAAGPPPHEDEGPGFTITNFVAWYNLTYVGLPGSRSRSIPDCWPHHPGLASEIGTLAYAWHDAFTGDSAAPTKAQLWHHHDRPGFADRLTHEWTHPHCHDKAHKQAGASSRPDRHGLTSETGAVDDAP